MGFFSSLFGGPKVDYSERIANGAVVVDVRSPQEFSMGHFKGSKNIPLQTFASKVKSLKGKEVVVVCRSGARASQAKGILERNGIVAHNAGSWQNL